MHLKPISRHCPSCSKYYNVLGLESSHFECQQCHSPLFAKNLVKGRMIAATAAFVMPSLLSVIVESTPLWFPLGIVLGLFLYINLVSLELSPALPDKQP